MGSGSESWGFSPGPKIPDKQIFAVRFDPPGHRQAIENIQDKKSAGTVNGEIPW
jgi:hypothetical protein